MVDIQEVELVVLPANKISKAEFLVCFYSHILVHLALHYCSVQFIHSFIFNWGIIASQCHVQAAQ